MVAAVTTRASQLPAETVVTAVAATTRASQLPVEAVITTTADTAFASQLPVEAVWNATGGNHTQASQLVVEVVLRGRPTERQLRAWTFNLDGHSFYVLQLGTRNGTLVYDQTTGSWFEWQSFTSENSAAPWRGRCGWNWNTDIVVGDDNFGLLWNIKTETYQDETPLAGYANYDVIAVLTGGLNQTLRNTTPCNGVMMDYMITEVPTHDTHVKLETSDNEGRSFDDQGTIALTGADQEQIQWLSLGRIVMPLRVFKLTDNGIPSIDGLEMF